MGVLFFFSFLLWKKTTGNDLNVCQDDNGKIKHEIFRVQSDRHYTMEPTCDLHTWFHLYWVIMLPYFRPPHSVQGTIDQACHGQELPSFTEMPTKSCSHYHFGGVKDKCHHTLEITWRKTGEVEGWSLRIYGNR